MSGLAWAACLSAGFILWLLLAWPARAARRGPPGDELGRWYALDARGARCRCRVGMGHASRFTARVCAHRLGTHRVEWAPGVVEDQDG